MAASQEQEPTNASQTTDVDDLDYDVECILNEHGGKYKIKFSGIDPSTGRPWDTLWYEKEDVREEYPEVVRRWEDSLKEKAKRKAEAEAEAKPKKKKLVKRKRSIVDGEDEPSKGKPVASTSKAPITADAPGTGRSSSRAETDYDSPPGAPAPKRPKPTSVPRQSVPANRSPPPVNNSSLLTSQEVVALTRKAKKPRVEETPPSRNDPPDHGPLPPVAPQTTRQEQSQGEKSSSSGKRTIIPDSQPQADTQNDSQSSTQNDTSRILPASLVANKPRPSITTAELLFRPDSGPAPRAPRPQVVDLSVSSQEPSQKKNSTDEDPISQFSSPDKSSLPASPPAPPVPKAVWPPARGLRKSGSFNMQRGAPPPAAPHVEPMDPKQTQSSDLPSSNLGSGPFQSTANMVALKDVEAMPALSEGISLAGQDEAIRAEQERTGNMNGDLQIQGERADGAGIERGGLSPPEEEMFSMLVAEGTETGPLQAKAVTNGVPALVGSTGDSSLREGGEFDGIPSRSKVLVSESSTERTQLDSATQKTQSRSQPNQAAPQSVPSQFADASPAPSPPIKPQPSQPTQSQPSQSTPAEACLPSSAPSPPQPPRPEQEDTSVSRSNPPPSSLPIAPSTFDSGGPAPSYDSAREAALAEVGSGMTQATYLGAASQRPATGVAQTQEDGDTTRDTTQPSSSTVPPVANAAKEASKDAGEGAEVPFSDADLDFMNDSQRPEVRSKKVLAAIGASTHIEAEDKAELADFMKDPEAYPNRTDARLNRRPLHVFTLQEQDDGPVCLCIALDPEAPPQTIVRRFTWNEYAMLEENPATQTQAISNATEDPYQPNMSLIAEEEPSQPGMPPVTEQEAAAAPPTMAQKVAGIHAEMQTDAEVPLDQASLADLVLARAQIQRLADSQAATAGLYSAALSALAEHARIDNKAYDVRSELEDLRRERDKLAADKDRLLRQKKTSEQEFAYMQQKCQSADIEATGLRGHLLALQDELAATKKKLSQGMKQVNATYSNIQAALKEDLRMAKKELELNKDIVLRTERLRIRAAEADEEEEKRLEAEKTLEDERNAMDNSEKMRENAELKARELALENEDLRKHLRVARVRIAGLETREAAMMAELQKGLTGTSDDEDGSGSSEVGSALLPAVAQPMSKTPSAGKARIRPELGMPSDATIDAVAPAVIQAAPLPIDLAADISQVPLTQAGALEGTETSPASFEASG